MEKTIASHGFFSYFPGLHDSAAHGLRWTHYWNFNVDFYTDFMRAKSAVRSCSLLQLGILPSYTHRILSGKGWLIFCVIIIASNPRDVRWCSKSFSLSQRSLSACEGAWGLAELLQSGGGLCVRVEGRSSVPCSTVLSLLPPHLLIPAQNGFQALCLEEREDDCVSFKMIIVMNTIIGKPVIS